MAGHEFSHFQERHQGAMAIGTGDGKAAHQIGTGEQEIFHLLGHAVRDHQGQQYISHGAPRSG